MADVCDSDLENGIIRSQQDSTDVNTQNRRTLSPTFKTPSIRRQVKNEQTTFLNPEIVTSNLGTDGHNEADCVIPILRSNRSSLLQHRGDNSSGTPQIPESLCTFLDTENTSWSSSLASTTPCKSNVTYSDFNTEEKKVFIPIFKDQRKPRVLFTPEPDEQVLCRVLDSSFNESGALEVIPKHYHLNSPNLEDSYDHITLLSDGSINTTVKNTCLENGELRERDCEPTLVKEVLDLLCSPVGSIRGRKKVDHKCSIFQTPSHQSGPNISSKILFSANHSKSINKLGQDGTPKNLTVSYMNTSSEDKNQEHSESHEFLNDISFGTLEEVCRASEMVASTAAPPSFSNTVNATNLINQAETSEVIVGNELNKYENSHFSFETIPLSKTSTPISDKHKQTFGEAISTKRKIKFVNNVEESHLNVLVQSENPVKIKKSLPHSQHHIAEIEVKCDINSTTELHDIGSNSFVKPLVSVPEENSHESKMFLYFTNENVSIGQQGQRPAESVLKNILISARTLETEMPFNVNSNLPSKLTKLKTDDKNCGYIQNFVTFHKLQDAQVFMRDNNKRTNECDIEMENSYNDNLCYESQEGCKFMASMSKTFSDKLSQNCESNSYFGPVLKDIESELPSTKIAQDDFINTNKNDFPTGNRKRLIGETFSECTEHILPEGCVFNTTKKLKLKVAKHCGSEKQVQSTIYDGKTINKNEQNESFTSLSSKQMTLNNVNLDINGCNPPKKCVAQFEDSDLCESQMLHELDKVEVICKSNIQLQNRQANINMSSNITSDEKLCKLKPCQGNKIDLTDICTYTNESLLKTSCELNYICSKKIIESQSNFDKVIDIPLPSNGLNKESSLQSCSGLLEDLDSCNSGFLNSEQLSPTLKSAYKKRKRSKRKQIKHKEKCKRIKQETHLTLENCDEIQNIKQNNDQLGVQRAYEHYELCNNKDSSNKLTNLGKCITEKCNSIVKTAEFGMFVTSHSDQENKSTEELEESFLSKNEINIGVNETCKVDNTTVLKSKQGSCSHIMKINLSEPQVENLSASDTGNATIINYSISPKINQVININVGNKSQSEESKAHLVSEILPNTLPERKVYPPRMDLQNLSISLYEAELINQNKSNYEKDCIPQDHLNNNSTIFNSESRKEIRGSEHSPLTASKFFEAILTPDLKKNSKYITSDSGKKCEGSLQSTMFPDKDDSLNCLNDSCQNDSTEPHLVKDHDNISFITESKVNCSPSSIHLVPDTCFVNIVNISQGNDTSCFMTTDCLPTKGCNTLNTENNTDTQNTEPEPEKSNIEKIYIDTCAPKLSCLEDNLSAVSLPKADKDIILLCSFPKTLASLEKIHLNNKNKSLFIKDKPAKPSTSQIVTTGQMKSEVSYDSIIEQDNHFQNTFDKYKILPEDIHTVTGTTDVNTLDETKEINRNITQFEECKIGHSLKYVPFSYKEYNTSGEKFLKITEKKTLENVSESTRLKSENSLKQIHFLNKGFSSAGGRLLKVSEKSLKKAKEILEDISESGDCGHSIKELWCSNKSFKCAQGKDVNLSEKCHLEAKDILGNTGQLNECENESSLNENLFFNKGFATAGGRFLNVSEKSLKKAKEILDDVSEPAECGHSMEESLLSNKCFTTAGGKDVSVSEKSPMEGIKLLDNVGQFNECRSEHSLKQINFLNMGFATAGGRLLKVSEKSVKKAKEILEDIGESPECAYSVEEPLLSNKCFTTAGKKKVIVSEISLLEARDILDNGGQSNKCQGESSLKQINFLNNGFATAGGRLLKVSEKSLNRAKEILEDVGESAQYGHSIKEPQYSNNSFKSTGGKIVNQSEKCLLEAKDILGNTSQLNECENENSLNENLFFNKGFATAGGRLLNVSEKSLKKAKDILDGVGESAECGHSMEEPLFSNNCFNTAGGKDVSVSEKSPMDNVGQFNECRSENSLKQIHFLNKGFATAGGRLLKVSEKSLKKAKEILDDVGESAQYGHSIKEPQYSNNSFKSTGGKIVNQSEKCLLEAKDILGNTSQLNECENENSLNENLFFKKGFATAGGRLLNVSEKSLMKAKEILDGVGESAECGHSMEEPLFSNNCFNTAGGKDVSVSEKSPMEGIKLLDNVGQFNECRSENSLKQIHFLNKGFATAGGRLLKVSEKSLKEAKAILDNVGESAECGLSKEEPLFSNKYFTAAEGKKMIVQERSVMEAKDFLCNGGQVKCQSEHSFKQKLPLNEEFTTASGSLLEVSEISVKKAKEILEDVCDSTESGHSIKEPLFSNKCFSTGSGKDVNISEKSVPETKEMIVNGDQFHLLKQNLLLNKGFITAGGRQVNVSEKSLKKAKEILDDVGESGDCGHSIKEPQYSNKSLKCAGGKNVNLSEKCLLEANDILGNRDELNKCQNENSLNEKQFFNKGFATAGGRLLNVSEKSLNKAKEILEDIGESAECGYSIEEPMFSNHMFSTAGGKEGMVPKRFITEAKDILHNWGQLNECESEHSLKQNLLSTEGFTTASRRLLEVSENSLKKAKQILNDVIESNEGQSVHSLQESPISNNAFNTVQESVVKVLDKTLSNANEVRNSIGEFNQCQNIDLIKYPYFGAEGLNIAGGKVLKMSEKSASRNKEILKGMNISTECQSVDLIKKSVYSSYGLTAQGVNEVNVSGKSFNKAKQNVANCEYESQLGHRVKNGQFSIEIFTNNCGNLVKEFDKSLRRTEGNFQEMRTFTRSALHSLSCNKNNEEIEMEECMSELTADADVQPIGVQMLNTAVEKSIKERNIDEGVVCVQAVSNTQDLKEVCLNDELLNKKEDNSLIFNSNVSNTILTKERGRFIDGLNVCDMPANRTNYINYCNEPLKTGKKIFEISKDIWTDGKEKKTVIQHEVNRQEEIDSINCFSDATTKNMGPRHLSENTDQINKSPVCNMSLTQEVSESTAALLADELSGFHENECIELEFAKNEDSCDKEPSSPVLCHKRSKKSKKNRSHKSRMSLPSNLNLVDQTSAFLGVLSPPLPSFLENHSIKKNLRKDNDSPNKPLMLSTKIFKSNIAAVRQKAAEDQQKAVEACKNKVKPCKGSLLLIKESFPSLLLTWKKVTKGHPPMAASKLELLQYGVRENVLLVSASNAVEFKFHASEFCSPDDPLVSIPVGDSAEVIPNAVHTIGITEVERAFLVSPGVDPALVPEGWIHNHYRWIVWKLVSMERSFPYIFAGNCLTLHVVLQQLKYRYDREIDHSQRSALRRILECDDTANKRLTLCVAHISKAEASIEEKSEFTKKIPSYEIELTDGWYGIKACIDTEMVALIDRGKVSVGTKLITYGAELLNCSQGCSPLEEASKTARLRIHTNSTRRTCWDTKLGYYYRPDPFSISLSSVLPAGGLIGSVTVLVVRVYPVIYMEKSADDRTAFHSARIESRKAAEFDQKKQLAMEQIYSQEKAKILKGRSIKCNRLCHVTKKQLSCITSGEELDVILQGSADPAWLQVMMTEDQRRSLAAYQGHKNEKTLQELQERVQKVVEQKKLTRSSTPLLKVRCLDICNSGEKGACLSIWRPSEEVFSFFKEGFVLKLFNVSSSGYRLGELQITSTKQTCYKLLSNSAPSYPHRVSTPFDKVISQTPLFGELDCVGVVVHLCLPTSNTQTLFLADGEMSIIGITFWSNIKASGWQDVLQRQSIVACSNLQWRSGAAVKWVPSAYATEFSLFTQQPQQSHLKDAFVKLREKIFEDIKNFTDRCEEIVLSMLNDPNMIPRMIKSPNDTTKHPLETAPMSKQLSEKVNHRLFKLEHYGDPPALSPLHLCVPKDLCKEFKAPTRILEEIIPKQPLPQERSPL